MGRERCEDIHRLLLWKKNCEFLGLSLLRNSRQNEASSLSPGKIVLHTMELLGLKSKTFFITPGNANSFFNWTLEFPQYNFSIYPQEISGLQPSPLYGIFSEVVPIAMPLFYYSNLTFWMKLTGPLLGYSRKTSNRWGVGRGWVGILFWNAPPETKTQGNFTSVFL